MSFKIVPAVKGLIEDCDAKINEINTIIDKKNKKQKGGDIINKIDNNEILYLLLPTL